MEISVRGLHLNQQRKLRYSQRNDAWKAGTGDRKSVSVISFCILMFYLGRKTCFNFNPFVFSSGSPSFSCLFIFCYLHFTSLFSSHTIFFPFFLLLDMTLEVSLSLCTSGTIIISPDNFSLDRQLH